MPTSKPRSRSSPPTVNRIQSSLPRPIRNPAPSQRPLAHPTSTRPCKPKLPHQLLQHHRITAAPSHDPVGPFDCKICLDQAKDAVVTCCGHLFCWPCLFQWLKRTSRCAVCLGFLQPGLVFPIFGADADNQHHHDHDDNGAKKSRVPPRPPGRRFDLSKNVMY